MTFSKTITLGCLATLATAVSLQSWSAERYYSPNNQPLGSVAPIVLANANLSDGSTKGYRPWFENGTWQGDLLEYTVTSEGALSTSVDVSTTPPTNTGSKSNWAARIQFAAKVAANSAYWNTGRRIITWDSSTQTQVPFRFSTNNGIGVGNMALLFPSSAEQASKILNYVRGDRSNENPHGVKLRKRSSILGDIIHSKPVYVGAPNANISENNYAAWAAEKRDRAPRVYVGANDGMLHVFDAKTGDEVYAYVPSMLIGNLSALTATPYQHRYFVDGEMSVRDVCLNDCNSDSDWHTVLAGSLGMGGKGFFGLDITDPDLAGETANTGTNKKVLFEFNATADPDDMGDSFSRPVIAKLNDGHWYVVTGNGYNSKKGIAILYLVNLDTLALTKLSTSSGSAGSPNGLSSPGLLDTNRDGKADYAYAGDIDGNLWKFDLSGSSANAWDVAYNHRPLHPSAGDQSIVHAPQIARHPQNGYMLYFATGRLITDADLNDTSVQSLYGIWDSGETPPTSNQQHLLEQIWDGPKTYSYTTGVDDEDLEGSSATQTIAIYNVDAGNPNWATDDGWKVDFPAGGYRVLQPVQVRANRVKATVYKPGSENQQGENWLIEALITDGGPNPIAAPIYDLNVDGNLTTADLYDSSAEDDETKWHVPMMWRQTDGIMSQVTIAYLGVGRDTLFINYLQPPIGDTPCTGRCSGGFLGGYIDVQTYQDDVGQAIGYDRLADRVDVDYFNLFLPVSVNRLCEVSTSDSVLDLVEINSDGTDSLCGYPKKSSDIDSTEDFIVLLANADLSPGSTLRIGNKTWNVVDYQIQIANALRNWNPGDGSEPVDADGDLLVFNWGDIERDGGTISHNFDDRALIDGGLHPTQPNCVANPAEDPSKTGRTRNGALTTQLVKKSYFTTNPLDSAIAMVNNLHPTDLVPYVTTKEGDRYETVGGLIAQHSAERIWESALFWDFGDLTEAAGLGRPCYGDPKWEEAVTIALSNNPISAILAKRRSDLNSDTLAAAVAKYCNPNCTGDWAIMKSLLELSKDYIRTGFSGAGSGSSPFVPTPNKVYGGGTGAGLQGDGGDGAITEGPAYEPGRKSWTDVVK